MFNALKNEKNPTIAFSCFNILMISAVLCVGILSGAPVAVLLLINIALLFIVGMTGGIKYNRMEAGMLAGVRQAISCVLILVFVGVTIATWIQCGTVPMLIYYGLGILTSKTVLPATFVLCSLLSVFIGTSWGTAGTIGIACVSIGVSLGVPAPIMVGAAISGSIFGDKLSPLSDTTILASSVSDVNIYRHIKAMMMTTIPSFVIACVLYYFMGLPYAGNMLDATSIEQIHNALAVQFSFNPLLLLPMIIMIVMSVSKVPALLTLLVSGLSGGILSYFVQGASVINVLTVMNTGYHSESGVVLVDTMLSKGGLSAMFGTICIAILALALGGILDEAGYLRVIVMQFTPKIKSDRGTVLTSLFTGILVVMLVTNFYVAAVLISTLFRESYDIRGIDRAILSRTIEDSTTIMLPLVPWNTSCIYYVGLFGVAASAFAPFTIFCWINILLSVVCTSFGLLINRLKND